VDHRLRLFLDVEVFADAQEEFQCCLKVPLVLAGHPGESVCLVVVSDRRLYVLKVTGEICGPPASWRDRACGWSGRLGQAAVSCCPEMPSIAGPF